MSKSHDQAMHNVYQQVLYRLLEHMSQAQRASLQLLIQRLLVAAGGLERMGDFTLLLLDTGDRRSAHALACLRAAQLVIATRSACTFRLRVAVARVAGVGRQQVENCERYFSMLVLHDDPRVELLMVEQGQAMPFDARRPAPQLLEEREAFLLFGHMTSARPPCLLGSRLHLALADAYTKVLDINGASALVCAVPLRQRHRYVAWARRCLGRAGQPAGRSSRGCARTLADGLSHVYQELGRRMQGAEPGRLAQRYCVAYGVPMAVIAVDELLVDLAAPERLDAMLGYRQGWGSDAAGLASSADLALVAHLHGLQGEHLSRRGYAAGFDSYARRLYREGQAQDLPSWETVRCEASAYFEQAFELRDPQLACLLYAPFTAHGQRLEYYVRRCHPTMRVALPYLHRALQGRDCPRAVEQWLVTNSGLSVAQLQRLYRHRPSSGGSNPLLSLLAMRGLDLRR